MEKLEYENQVISYTATTPEERIAVESVLKDYIKGRSVINKSYNQFNGRNLFDYIDDSSKRWNGYIPQASPMLEKYQSRIFLNWTRNKVIEYLSKVALNMTEPKIVAVNKKTGIQNKVFANVLKDLNQFSLNEENGEARFLESAIECTVKGTVIKYEGYRRQEQEMEIPESYDAVNGKIKTKKETKVIYDNCYQEIVPLEDFYIANAYESDIQKQPFVIWRKITSRNEAKSEYGNFSNFDDIPESSYTISAEPTTFYRNSLQTDLGKEQVEIIKYFNRHKNVHRVVINGRLIYDGVIPFKDGKYPFAKGIFEPFGAGDFFWGASFPAKIEGDQDLRNTLWNMMVDKTYGSLLPFGLSSDLDDMIEDEYLQPNKVRKVNNINNWRFETLPGVSPGEMGMLNTAMQLGNENSGNLGGMGLPGQQKGKITARQALLQQQQSMQMLGFSMSFLEDFEKDRTDLRIHHILQFYSIPRIEKITGKNGKEVERLMFREVRLTGVKLSDGKEGSKVLKLTKKLDEKKRTAMAEELSVIEAMGEVKGSPTEALAVSIDTFTDYNFSVQTIKNSSYLKTSVLDQASRMEFANWRLGLAQVAPVDSMKLIKWVEEPFEIDPTEFELPEGQNQNPMQQMMQAQAGQQGQQAMQPAQQMSPNKVGSLNSIL